VAADVFEPTGTTHKRTGHRVGRSIAGVAMAAALLSAFGGVASAAPGDTSTGSTTAHVGVESGITMTGLTASFTLTGAPGATITGADAVTFNVETNNVAGYAVTVQPAASQMTPALGGNADFIPIAALTVREGGTGTYTPLDDVNPVTVHSQNSRSVNGGDVLTNDFQIRIPVVNVDTYSATLNYVATTL